MHDDGSSVMKVNRWKAEIAINKWLMDFVNRTRLKASLKKKKKKSEFSLSVHTKYKINYTNI